jgi:pimeloyl-ACP methyl ester carboxylesterase
MIFRDFGDKIGLAIAPDAVNHCDSYVINRGKLGPQITWSDNGRDLIKVLRDLNVAPESTIVIGHSMGGTTALYSALYEPSLFDSVVVLDPVVHRHTDNLSESAMGFGILLSRVVKSAKDYWPSRAELDKYLTGRSVIKTFDPEVRKRFVEANFVENSDGSWIHKTPVVQQAAAYIGAQYVFQSPVNQFCGVPHEVLVVKGEVAEWNPPGAMDRLIETLNNAREAEVPQGDHLMSLQMPKETYHEIRGFLEKRINRALARLDERAHLTKTIGDANRENSLDAIRAQIATLATGTVITYSRL